MRSFPPCRHEMETAGIEPAQESPRLGVVRESHSPATRRGYRKGCKPGNAGRRWPAEPLTTEEVSLLLSGCSRISNIGVRNRAIIAMLYRVGLRIAEAMALYPRDVDGDRHMVTVRHGKGDKVRRAGIDDGALEYLTLWEARREGLGIDGTYPLFCSLHATPLYAAYVRAMLKRIAGQAGIRKRVHPHGMRHTMAFELAMEKQPLPVIQHQLGHSSLATTAHYVDHLAPDAVLEVMAGRQW